MHAAQPYRQHLLLEKLTIVEPTLGHSDMIFSDSSAYLFLQQKDKGKNILFKNIPISAKLFIKSLQFLFDIS